MSHKLLEAKWDSGTSIISIEHSLIISKEIKFLLIDVDGTLIPRTDSIIHSLVKEWVIEAKKYFKIHLVSNNPSRKRIKHIAKQLDLSFTFRAGKPGTRAILKYINEINAKVEEVAIIGDRIFTDVLAGNRIGIYTILVNPIDSNTKQNISSKTRMIENIIANVLGAF